MLSNDIHVLANIATDICEPSKGVVVYIILLLVSSTYSFRDYVERSD